MAFGVTLGLNNNNSNKNNKLDSSFTDSRFSVRTSNVVPSDCVSRIDVVQN